MSQKLEIGCAALGALCLIYYMVIVLYAGLRADFAWFWAAGGIGFLLYGFLIRQNELHPHAFTALVIKIVFGLVLAVLVFMGVAASKIITAMTEEVPQNLEYVIVLGAQVRGTKPSKALRRRLVCAAEYAKKNPKTLFFLSGGQGSGEEITEAEAMKQFLVETGVEKDRLILEDRSTTTKENLEFCSQIRAIKDRRVGILSNDFHLYRAGLMAKKLGYQKISCIPAPSDPVMQVHYVVREIFALVLAKVRGAV